MTEPNTISNSMNESTSSLERRCDRCKILIDDCIECRESIKTHGCHNGNWHVWTPDPRSEKDIVCLCNWCHKEYRDFIATNCRRWMNLFKDE
jgi:hypothetical protein